MPLLSRGIEKRQTSGNEAIRRSVSSVAEETGEYSEELA
jgi:hypothetical protein